MDFIEAVLEIAKRPDLSICPNEDERSGKRDVCVYRSAVANGPVEECLGKLRWPMNDSPAYVDEAVVQHLESK